MRYEYIGILFLISLLTINTTVYGAGDWPMWRYDHERKAFAEVNLPDNPVLLWTRQLEEPRRGWPFQYEDYFTGGNPDRIGKLSFDISYEPVAAGDKLFVPSMVSDRVTAYSARNGKEIWRFYVGGPVRFAPVYDSGSLYIVSDDGYLYCLDAETGRPIWKFHGSYSGRMVLGNERVISMWPARGGPVIKDGIIYFAAGVMPFEGIFIHAVNAATGERVWTNSATGTIWNLHQHGGAWSYGGPSPQGYLAINGDKLIVPGGRTPPAVFDRKSGEFLYFNQATVMVGKGAGGYRVFASGDWFLNHGMLYSMDDGAQFGPVPGDVLTPDTFIGVSGDSLIAHKSTLRTVKVEIEDRLQRGAIAKQYELQELWKATVDGLERLYFRTGSHYVLSKNGGSTVSLVAVNAGGLPGEVVWEKDVEGEIWSMLAGNGNLYIVTREGKIYCFGDGISGNAVDYPLDPVAYESEAGTAGYAASIIEAAGTDCGYGLIYGTDDAGLIKALAGNSSMHFVVAGIDPEKINGLRYSLDKAGIYGTRVSVSNSTQESEVFLPYIYSLLVFSGGGYSDDQILRAFSSLRPYGGAAFFDGKPDGFSESFDNLSPENAEIILSDDYALVFRHGPLPGSSGWTHQYGSASNRTYSDDRLVKPPLGTLWFGGPSNLSALPRHHNGPIPQIAGGRLFILGVETISARCVYTGRELWVREIPGIGHRFTDLEYEERFRTGNEVYMPNHPGANFIGSPYVSLEDAVYVIHGDRLMSLNAATGETEIEFYLPQVTYAEVNEFSHLMVSGDYLITTIDPQIFDDNEPGKSDNWNATSSNFLIVMNRHSGELLWTRRAETGFRHNAITSGNGRLFIVDGLSEGVVEILQRRGMDQDLSSWIMALDLKTGQEIWAANDDVFGTWLGYYEDKDILLQGGRRGQRRAPDDEPNDRLTAHNGSTGEIIWVSTSQYSGPLGLHPDMIISGRPGEPALNPYTGEYMRKHHPLTGEEYNWNWHKYYGCGTMNSSKYLIMFRSGTAGYTDLLNFGGTGNLGGFRAGCTNSMVAADGVLNAPDYTRTCTCSYPLQTSVGMVHMPQAGIEMWTLNRLGTGSGPVRSMGINFAGQGNRKEDGVLWIEYPKVYAAGPDLPLIIESDSPEWFRNHATWIANGNEKYDWVASYGVKGITSITVDLVPDDSPGERYYNVTLYFAEPEDLAAGERLFDVYMQGNKVIENIDIVKETGGFRRVLRKEVSGIRVDSALRIDFANGTMAPVISGVEIVMDEHTATVKQIEAYEK